MLHLLYRLQEYLKETSGLAACSLQPAAGAHGERTALWVAAAYFRDESNKTGGENRTKVLVPDSAHGTNPASCAMCGASVVTVKSRPDGLTDLEDLKAHLTHEVAAVMVTNPNTVGRFDAHVADFFGAWVKYVNSHGGIDGHMPPESLRNVLDGLEKSPRWKVTFEIEPYSWAAFAKSDPQSIERLKKHLAAATPAGRGSGESGPSRAEEGGGGEREGGRQEAAEAEPASSPAASAAASAAAALSLSLSSHLRAASIAARGRPAQGYSFSNKCSTCSAP